MAYVHVALRAAVMAVPFLVALVMWWITYDPDADANLAVAIAGAALSLFGCLLALVYLCFGWWRVARHR